VKSFATLVVLKLVTGVLSGSIGLISDGMDAAMGDPGTLA
jgi:divalent metal cation (Fe/Co/Zn/Cd) transporter